MLKLKCSLFFLYKTMKALTSRKWWEKAEKNVEKGNIVGMGVGFCVNSEKLFCFLFFRSFSLFSLSLSENHVRVWVSQSYISSLQFFANGGTIYHALQKRVFTNQINYFLYIIRIKLIVHSSRLIIF